MTDTPPRDDPAVVAELKAQFAQAEANHTPQQPGELAENPPKAAMCEHYWASHVLGGFPIAVRTCQLCRVVDWDDLKRELEGAFGRGSVVRAKRAKSMLRFIKANVVSLPGWQEAWFTEAMQVYGSDRPDDTASAPSAYQRSMQIARDGSDPVDLDAFRVAVTQGARPRFDTLSDDHLDVLYDLIARGQRETWDRQATVIAKQVTEIGDLKRAVEETDQERVFQKERADKHWGAVTRFRVIAGSLPADTRARLLAALDDTPEQP